MKKILCLIAVVFFIAPTFVAADAGMDLKWEPYPSVFAQGNPYTLTLVVQQTSSANGELGTVIVNLPGVLRCVGVEAQFGDGTPLQVSFDVVPLKGVILTSKEIIPPNSVVFISIDVVADEGVSGFYLIEAERDEGEADRTNNTLQIYYYVQGEPCWLSAAKKSDISITGDSQENLGVEISRGGENYPGVGEARLEIKSTHPVTLHTNSDKVSHLHSSQSTSLWEIVDLIGEDPISISFEVEGARPNVIWGIVDDPTRREVDERDNHFVDFLGGYQPDRELLIVDGARLSSLNASTTRVSVVTALAGNRGHDAHTSVTSECSFVIESGKEGYYRLWGGDYEELIIKIGSQCSFSVKSVAGGMTGLYNHTPLNHKVYMPMVSNK